jgi:hypothetical protein
MTEQEWYCNLDGEITGPVSVRGLRTMAAVGELLPTDEVRCGLEATWRAASSVQGLEFGSPRRRSSLPKTGLTSNVRM